MKQKATIFDIKPEKIIYNCLRRNNYGIPVSYLKEYSNIQVKNPQKKSASVLRFEIKRRVRKLSILKIGHNFFRQNPNNVIPNPRKRNLRAFSYLKYCRRKNVRIRREHKPKIRARSLFIKTNRLFNNTFEKKRSFAKKQLRIIRRYYRHRKFLQKLEYAKYLRMPARIKKVFRWLSKMPYKLHAVYITEHRRNAFVSVRKYTRLWGRNAGKTALLYKSSVGCLGYRGPKKKTRFVHEEVFKHAGFFMGKERISAFELNFPRGFRSRVFRRYGKALFASLMFVTNITINNSKPHAKRSRFRAKRRV